MTGRPESLRGSRIALLLLQGLWLGSGAIGAGLTIIRGSGHAAASPYLGITVVLTAYVLSLILVGRIAESAGFSVGGWVFACAILPIICPLALVFRTSPRRLMPLAAQSSTPTPTPKPAPRPAPSAPSAPRIKIALPAALPNFASIELADSKALGDAGPGGQSFQDAISNINSGNDEDAIASFKKAMGTGLDPLRMGYAHANIGQLLLKKRDLQGAIDEFLRVFEAKSALYDSAHTAGGYLGIIMTELGKRKAAEELSGLVARTSARLGYSLAPDAAERARSLARGAEIAVATPPGKPAEAARRISMGDIVSREGLRPLGNGARLGALDYRAQFGDRESAERFYRAFVAFAEKNPPPRLLEVIAAFTPNTIYPEKYAFILPYVNDDDNPAYRDWARDAMRNCADAQRQHSYSAGNSYEYVPRSIGPTGCVFAWTILPPKGFDPESPAAKALLSDPPGAGFAVVAQEGRGNAVPEKPNPAGPWIGVLFDIGKFDEALYGAAATKLLLGLVGSERLTGSVIHGGDLLPDCRYWCNAIRAASAEQADLIEAAVLGSGHDKLAKDRSPVIRGDQVPVGTLPFQGFVGEDGSYIGN